MSGMRSMILKVREHITSDMCSKSMSDKNQRVCSRNPTVFDGTNRCVRVLDDTHRLCSMTLAKLAPAPFLLVATRVKSRASLPDLNAAGLRQRPWKVTVAGWVLRMSRTRSPAPTSSRLLAPPAPHTDRQTA